MKKKAYKKAVQPTTDRTAKAPKKGTKTKNRKSVSICQLKDIFKQFVKEQYENDCKRYKQHTQEYLKEHTDPSSILWAKQAEVEKPGTTVQITLSFLFTLIIYNIQFIQNTKM